MSPHPDPSKVWYKDKDIGKSYPKPKPEGFQDSWDKKHGRHQRESVERPFCETNPATCVVGAVVVIGAAVMVCVAQPQFAPVAGAMVFAVAANPEEK